MGDLLLYPYFSSNCESDISFLPTVQSWIMGDLLLCPYISSNCINFISVFTCSTVMKHGRFSLYPYVSPKHSSDISLSIMNHGRSIIVPFYQLYVWKWYLRFYLQYNNESWEIYNCTLISTPSLKVIFPFLPTVQ